MLRTVRWLWLPLLAVLCVSVALAPKRALAGAVPLPPGAPWFNVSRPLTPNDLKGRVVLLDFFTPGCINCVHMLPDMAKLEREFGARLLIIGVNSPKFVASRRSSNIEGFIQRYDITHPVLTDKGMTLWNYYGVQAWPTLVLLNPRGGVVQQFIGEGNYRGIRAAVLGTIDQAQRAGTLVSTALPLRPPVLSRAGLLQPGKVAVDARYVAVADSGHNRVVLLDHVGEVLRVIGTGVPGARDGAASVAQFDGPQGLAFVGD
ncbi:MAG: thioredoxin-like domain-containing protein, partial [Metallibacterium sp.]